MQMFTCESVQVSDTFFAGLPSVLWGVRSWITVLRHTKFKWGSFAAGSCWRRFFVLGPEVPDNARVVHMEMI